MNQEIIGIPDTLDAVYGVHKILKEKVGEENIVGYKLGGVGALPGVSTAIVAALLFKDRVLNLNQKYSFCESKILTSIKSMNMFALEAEIGFLINGSKLQLLQQQEDGSASISSVSKAQVKEVISDVFLCLELVGTRFKDIENASACQKLADCICAGGVVIKSIPWDDKLLENLHNIKAEILVNGKMVAEGLASTVPGGSPLDALTWCVNDLASRKTFLRDGQLVITGKICVTKQFAADDLVAVQFGRLGRIAVTIHP